MTAKKLGLPKAMRIRRKRDFDRIYALRQKTSDRCLLVFAAKNGLHKSRVGVSVSRKHGPAVVRARLKRLLREAFRLMQHELPKGLDLVLIPRLGCETNLADLQCSLRRAARKLADRLTEKGN